MGHHRTLGKVFWLYGVVPSNLLWLAVAWLLQVQRWPGVTLGLLVGLLFYTAWIVTAIWRAAPGAENPRYGALAQALTVAWAINTVLMVAFLGARLLPASIGHG